MGGTPFPFVKPMYFTNAGAMASSYKLFCYLAGTTTKTNTYSDSGLTVANANPIILDAYGRASIYWPTVADQFSSQKYKLVLAVSTAADPPLPAEKLWTEDHIPAVAVFFAGLDVFANATGDITPGKVNYINPAGTGEWLVASSAADASSISAVILGICLGGDGAVFTARYRVGGRYEGLSGLTPGTRYYLSTGGALTSTAPAKAIVVGVADTATSLILNPSWGSASTSYAGLVGIAAQGWAGLKSFPIQPVAYGGSAATLPNTIGGKYLADMVTYTIPQNQTDVTETDTEIPANMLNADGKAVFLRWGSSVAMTGSNSHIARLNVGGTVVQAANFGGTAETSWYCEAMIIRVAAGSVDVMTRQSSPTLGLLTVGVTRVAGLNFAATIDLRSLYVTGATTTMTQSFFIAEAIG